jgi:hypothetical protein
MAPSVRFGLLFGAIGLVATLAIVLGTALGGNCSIGIETLGPVFAFQVGMAAAAGFATSHRTLQRGQSAFAGFAAASVGGLASVILLGLTLAHGWPRACTEEMRGISLFFVVVVTFVAAPVVSALGAGAGWLASLFLGNASPPEVDRRGSMTFRGKPADKRPN